MSLIRKLRVNVREPPFRRWRAAAATRLNYAGPGLIVFRVRNLFASMRRAKPKTAPLSEEKCD